MLKRGVIGHIKAQNWFAVVLDFLVVVLGVLLAFQITNWNDGRKAKAQLAEAETEIKSDLFMNYVYAKERLSLQACRVERLRDLSERLLEPGETWTGAPFGDGANRAIDQVFRSPNRPWGGRFWQAELARGTFSEMTARKREELDFVFKQSGDIEVQQNKITDLAARLKVLSNTMKLSHEDRMRYYDIVAEIDENSFWTELKASQLCAMIEGLGLSYDEEERKRLLPRVKAILDLDMRRKEYGQCVEPVIVSLFDAGETDAARKKSSCSLASYN